MNNENDKYWQQQILLQKPTFQQLLSQRFSCEVLFNLLSSGEKCVKYNNKKRKYRYYDPYNTSNYKNQEELEVEFRNQLRCFQACFLDDCKDNGGFRYPDNLDKQTIMFDINMWMEIAQKKERSLLYESYQKFLKLLEGEKIIVDKIYIQETESKDKSIKVNCKEKVNHKIRDLLNSAMLSIKQSYDMENIIKNDYKNGIYSINAKLNCDPPKSRWDKIKDWWYNNDEKKHNEDDFNNQ